VSSHFINPYEGCLGAWHRGNLHGHSREWSNCASVPLLEGIERYRALGARFLAITDHDHVSDLSAVRARWPDMVFLEGFEWSRSENLLFIGATTPPLYELPLADALRKADGLLTIVCHPKPSRGAEYWTVPMILGLSPAPIGIEVYNAHYSHGHRIFRDANPLYSDIWDALLSRGLRVWGFTNDDSHDPLDYGRTRTMVCVTELTEEALIAAFVAGHFYGSTGLLLEEVSVDGDAIHVRLSARANGRFVGPEGKVLSGANDTEFACRHSGESYIRFEAEGKDGRIFLQPFFAASGHTGRI
jgi:hypothetical protein